MHPRSEWEVREVATGRVVEGFDRLWPALALRDQLGDGPFAVFGRVPASLGGALYEVRVPEVAA